MKLFNAALNRANIAAEIQGFLGSIMDVLLKFIVILAAAAVIGFDLTALVGILAAAGFCCGIGASRFFGQLRFWNYHNGFSPL